MVGTELGNFEHLESLHCRGNDHLSALIYNHGNNIRRLLTIRNLSHYTMCSGITIRSYKQT
jgi:hypothetical protein